MCRHLSIWVFIIGLSIFCESQYAAPPDKQHWADALNITSLTTRPATLNQSKEVVSEHNSDVTIEELTQSPTDKELVTINDEITTTTIGFNTSTEDSVIKEESLVITTLSPNAEEFSTVPTTTKTTVNLTLDEAVNTNITSDDIDISNDSLQPSPEVPTKEASSVPKKGADPSLLQPSVVPKKEADPSSLFPSVVGKKGADPNNIKPSATGRKGADPTSLLPSVYARKGVVDDEEYDSESLQNSTSPIGPIEVHSKTDEPNMAENKSDITTQQTTTPQIKSSSPMSNEGDNLSDKPKDDSKPSSAVPSMRPHKYTPVIKPVPISTNGTSIEEVEVISTNVHMKPTAATDILEKNLQIEMIVEERSYSSGILIGCVLLLTVVLAIIFLGYRHFKEAWMKRHYSRMDFLVDGMYDM